MAEGVADMKWLAAISVLMALVPGSALAEETTIEYNRSEWRHWIQDDEDCQDLRQEVLIKESITTPTTAPDGCKVERGLWWDFFTGAYFSDPSQLDIDHLVPLKEAHLSGGWQWDRDKKRDYANSIDYAHHLVAVSRSANRSKGSKDPANWLPPNKQAHCWYVHAWMRVKERWALVMDKQERAAIDLVIEHQC